MAEFDIVSKQLFQDFTADFVRFVLGRDDATVLDVIDTEQPTVETHRADSVARVMLEGQEVLVHTEFQTSDSTETPMPIRMAGYIGWLIESYRLPVCANVIYLRPDAGRGDPGRYEQTLFSTRFLCEYNVMRLIEIDGEQVITQQLWGLLPFTPLMGHPSEMDAESWLRRCVQAADQAPFDQSRKATLLTDLAILSGLIHDSQTVLNILSEEIMQESSIIQHFTERATQQGLLQGQRQRGVEALLDVLEIRFDTSAVEALKPNILQITDLQILRQLHLKAVRAETLDDFRQFFDSIVQSNS